ncbi:SGNH family hydrolase [Undibacterium cyanobacteriorum]|uniref:SGNH family hydrolase n=1 Tax=Undibacterium cyanobacteriorum TaxID=3073561 RepID=A0ABY9RH91_9BURK|nr:SGNH family hydrolase [Undibacterium sp. 20NA77.5]WMW80598.1 SGNH family hydrolase [Undibacterium sp. 20NA77.5]
MRDGYENQKHAKKQRHHNKDARKTSNGAMPHQQHPIPNAANQDQGERALKPELHQKGINKVVPIKPPVVEVALEQSSVHWQTLGVLAATLALLFWLRQDALDQYWQQTRHLELGLSNAVDHPSWQSGAKWTKQLDRDLTEQLQVRQPLKERLVQSFNVLLFGLPEASNSESQRDKATQKGNTSRLAQKNQGSAVPTMMPSEASASSAQIGAQTAANATAPAKQNAAGEDGPSETPLTQFIPLNEDGRMVLNQQDKVLLVGDSMMQGVAPHVVRALQNAHVKSIDLSRQSTGLTYPGYYDWPAVIKKSLEKDRISVLVVFLGANDTWDMILGGKYESFGTERWQSNYLERVQSIVQIAHQQHVRVIWMGAPNMGREKINRGVKILNSLYAKGLGEGESRFISTRESLSDDVNEYRKTITKENGKSVVVRTEDGIHFTRDGQIILRDLVLKQFELPVVNKVSP